MPPARRPTVVLLVRHGRTPTTGRIVPGRAPGLHLSAAGRQEADAVARRIGEIERVSAVYASPLERARETAEPIARARGLRVRVESGLSEVDIGAWTGLSLGRLRRRAEWRIVQTHPSGFRFPRGESFTEMQTRVTSTLARLVDRHPDAIVVAVSHADPIKAALAHALGLHLDLFQRVAIAPGSITAIAYGAAAPTVLAVNAFDGSLTALGVR